MIEDWGCWGDEPECEHMPGMGGWFGFENKEQGAAISGEAVPHRWPDYIDGFDEEYTKCAEHIRRAILERWPTGNPPGGFWHQGQDGEDEGTAPRGACGGIASFSMRAWGDLIAAVLSSRDDKDYRYLDFAWYGPSSSPTGRGGRTMANNGVGGCVVCKVYAGRLLKNGVCPRCREQARP